MTTLWIAAAAVVAGGATTALATSGGSPGAKILTQSQVRTELANQQKPVTTGLKAPASTVQQTGDEWTVKLDVGTVYLRCKRDHKADRVVAYRAVGNPGYQAAIAQVALWIPDKGQPKTGAGAFTAVQGVLATFVKKGAKPVEIIGYRVGCKDGKSIQLSK